MKILGRHLDGNGEGHLKILPESTEDLWQLYNYVHPSDEVEALTYRYVSLSMLIRSVKGFFLDVS